MLPNFTADLILGIAVVSVASIVIFGMIWLFSTGASSTICGLTANLRSDALEDNVVAQQVADKGPIGGGAGVVNAVRLKFPWPLICKTEEKSFESDKEQIASILATASLSAWETMGSGEYILLVGDEDESHLNAKRMALFQTKIKGDAFYPSDFFNFIESKEVPGGKKIADLLPPQNLHFIYNGKVIDGLPPGDVGITGNVWLTLYFVDRVTGGTFNYFGRAVINAPECGIYGGFPSNSEIEEYTTNNKCESFGDIFKTKEKEYCECRKKVTEMPAACSYQMPSDQIWICVSKTSQPPSESDAPFYSDTLPPVISGFDYCTAESSCEPMATPDGFTYILETTNAQPLIRGRVLYADAIADPIVIKDSLGNIIAKPERQYGCTALDDCFFFTPSELGLDTAVVFEAQASDASDNTITKYFSLHRLPAVSATVDATDYVNSEVVITMKLNGNANNLKVSVTNGAVTFGPNIVGNVDADEYKVSFSGFAKEHEGVWNIVISGADNEGNEVNHIGEKTFVVDLTPPAASVDASFTQASGYTRGEAPQISVNNDKHYVTYTAIVNGEREVFVIETS